MAKEESNGVPEYEIQEATNVGNGRPTSKKSKANTSQIEKRCTCTRTSRDLLCPSHGEKKWLDRV